MKSSGDRPGCELWELLVSRQELQVVPETDCARSREGAGVLPAPKGTLRWWQGCQMTFELGGWGQQHPQWWQLGRLTG